MTKEELELNWNLRRMFANYQTVETMEVMTETLRKTKSNKDLLRAAPIVFSD